MATRNYASRLTKEDLIKSGITLVTEEGLVFRGEQPVKFSINTAGYWMISIYVLDENGNKIKKPIKRQYRNCKNLIDTYVFETRAVGLHRIMWAWFHDEVPEGYVVDHINNKHEDLEDYRLENLQLLTPQENVTKDRECSTRQLKCKLNKPRSYYEEKLERYEALYEEAKTAKNVDEAHKQRANIANIKARLRYWDTNREEIETNMNKQMEHDEAKAQRLAAKKKSIRDRKILEQYKQMFKEAGNKKMWHDICTVIKNWDKFDTLQQEHIFDTLHKFFDKYGISY